MAELDLDELISRIEDVVRKKLDKGLKTLFKKNVLDILRTKARADILEAFVQQYDALAAQEKSEYGPAIKDKDPSALENFRHLFVKQISEELDNIRMVGSTVIIEVGDREKWGVGRQDAPEGEPETVDFLGYYIDGVIGEFGFISIDHYRKRRKRRRNLGRFGKGFLISSDRYRIEKWEKVTGVSFSDIRHPISGQPPFKGFDLLAASLDFTPYIQEAVQKTFSEISQNIA